MAQDEAYRKAEAKIAEALRTGATELDLSGSHTIHSIQALTELPESLVQLPQLRTLDLSDNYLVSLPDFLRQLTQLRVLDLSNNRLKALPESLGELRCLRVLNVDGNQLSSLPESLRQLSQLEMLNVGAIRTNQLRELPEWLGEFQQLRTLEAAGNHLTSLPESLNQLSQLQELNVRGNEFSTVPDVIGKLQELETLWICENEFVSLSDSIGCLSRLKKLYLGYCRGCGCTLPELPKWLRKLKLLKLLAIQGCGVERLPTWLGELTDLQVLCAECNHINDVPTSLGFLENLRILGLGSNPLSPELAAAHEQGIDAVKEYLRAKAEDQIVLNEAKLILIGEGEVGKTSLLGALRGDKWEENRPTTHGVEVKIRSLVLDVPEDFTLPQGGSRGTSGEGDVASGNCEDAEPSPGLKARPSRGEGEAKRITFNGWDFGGQNIYRHTHQLFFTAPAVYLAVWNPRRGPEQCCVDEWIKMVRQRAYDESRPDDRPHILVVATHGGPNERSAHIDEQLLRDEFGDLIAGFHHVDSKTGYGLDELKQAIAREAAAIPSVGRSVPKSWKNLLDALQKRSRKNPYITYKQFLGVCGRQKIKADLAGTYAAILNELGYLICYQNDEVLQDTVILKPEYISKAISYVLEDQVAKDQNGLVRHDRLSEIWDDLARDERDRYPAELHRIFLRLMDRFDLSYQVVMPNENDPATSLVSQLVPGGRPKDWEQSWPSKPEPGDTEQRRICRLVDVETGRPTEVDGLLYRLIVRLHRYSLGRNNYFDSRHWKTGLILDDGINGRAFIEEIAGDVYVTVRAAYPDGFLGNLCGEIRSLIDQFWKGLDCRLSVPCHSLCRGLHELEELVETRRRGIAEIRCSVCRKFHEIDSLLIAASPKLPMEIVAAELRKVREQLCEVHADVAAARLGIATLDTDVREMIGQANEQFDLMMRAMTDLAKDGPRLFSFHPVDPGFWDKPKWISEKFRLTLWCEHSRLPLHVVANEPGRGVYEVDLKREWVKKAAPVLKVLSGTLSLALPITAPAAKFVMDGATYDAIEKQLNFGKACADSFLSAGDKAGEWLSGGEDSELNRGRVQLAEGSQLRELHALLKSVDPGNAFGGLARVQNKRREFLWVHEQFKNEY